ncbi:extensin family protein [Hydrogenophaga sp. BPS33]|nr:extensin family protein [Hydrogenophaga sp. BPS33]
MLLAAALLIAWALHSGRLVLPPAWNPWAPLDVAAPPNALTRYKLQRLADDPALCHAVLRGTTLVHTPVPDHDAGGGCGWQSAVRVTDARFAPAFTLTCSAAVALAMWERHALQPAALSHFAQPVAHVEHLGSYACRNVRGDRGEGAQRSQHALANALDVAGLHLRDGRRVRVLSDWPREPSAEASFLREVRDGACRFFNGTLSPHYNAAHRDHLHLDRGPYRMCR